MSFTGAAASVMDGRLLCVFAQSLADSNPYFESRVNFFHALRFTSIWRPSRKYNASPSKDVPIALAARRGDTGLT